MLRLLAAARFALTLVTSADAITPEPLHQPDEMITQIAHGCGAGRTSVGTACVARTTIRHTRRASRAIRRCATWHRGICAGWY